jgi:5-methylcytosine-specific restriction protein A
MPHSAPLACRHPGCNALVSVSGYCPAHQTDLRQWDNASRAKARRAKRGLSANSTLWRKIRATVLSSEPLCRHCQQAGRVQLAYAVDHIDGDSANNALSNLQPLCLSCHSRKTARFDGGFGNPKRPVCPDLAQS